MATPHVILIGDSIRMGYQAIVARELGAQATLWAPDENGGNSRNVLEHLEAWVLARQPDIVHLNCGLHDIKRDFETGALAIPLLSYTSNLRDIFTRLQAETDAIVIWATTTPVNEAWHHANKPFDRFMRDVVAYNAAALTLAQSFSLPVDNLYAAMTAAGPDTHLVSDGVHFNDAGYALLGKAVADSIKRQLWTL
jgi:lysophospholipase L1-like esterase